MTKSIIRTKSGVILASKSDKYLRRVGHQVRLQESRRSACTDAEPNHSFFELQTFGHTSKVPHTHRKHQITQAVAMSSNLPLRTIRIPALRQQCRFRQRAPLPTPRAFSTTTPQALGVTSPRLGRAGGSSNRLMISGAAKRAGQPSPEVVQDEAQQEGEMIEDIGLLQDTLVAARWRRLPPMWDITFWGYWYKVLKNKVSGLYS
jgi:hypothetical protein